MEVPSADVTEETLRQMVGVPILGPKEWMDQVYEEAFTKAFEYILYTGDFCGDILEFGTFRGYTAHILARIMRGCNFNGQLWLYDSFEGLPEISNSNDSECYLNKKGDWVTGGMSLPRGFEQYISESLENIISKNSFSIVKGYFEKTMEKNLTNEKAVLVHLDCDLFSSSKYVLEKLIEKDVLQDGTLLYCDDYNCNRSNLRMGQRGALSAVFTDSCRFTYSEYISYGWFGKAFFIHDKEA
ncbi:MAG: hypothetical protein ACI9S8_000077 [Chlamydiales bacterium]|jgi:hypothetical protein